jgi:hypothetical protein
MITDRDIEKLKVTFATNERVDVLSERVDVLADKVDGLTYQVGDLKVEFAELRDAFDALGDSLHTKLDKFLGKMDVMELENAAGTVILLRHTRQIDALGTHTGLILPA